MNVQGNRVEDGMPTTAPSGERCLAYRESGPVCLGCDKRLEGMAIIDVALLDLHAPEQREGFIASERAKVREHLATLGDRCHDCQEQ